MKHVRLPLCLCLAAAIAFSAIGCSWKAAGERAKSDRIAWEAHKDLVIGMTRDDARLLMSTAWKRYECDYSDWGEDVYLFGSRKTDLATIVLLRFECDDGVPTLEKISGLPYYYLYEYDNELCTVFEKGRS